MIDRAALLKDLQRQVRALERDLREQIDEVGEVHAPLRAEYGTAFKLGRTAATWTAWRDERVTQAAVAWVLGTVFVRFCEDNGLLVEPFLAGPSAERMTLAEEAQEQFFRDDPAQTDHGWLLAAFATIAGSQAGRLLFDARHNALYQIPASHDAAKALIAFWRRRDEHGRLVHDFTDAAWDTRFLGDLYEELSEAAREKYALRQTPEFVEEFILDRTLTPAIEEFGYDTVKLIDPTCGSGHFLLGTFRRLLTEWETHSPARDIHERVRLALEAVHGVDINPFAVAIARFRLLAAALRAADFHTLTEAAEYDFPINIAIGDSLIKARQLSLFDDDHDELAEFAYATEDVHEFPGLLKESRYHVVVGNPPYITVKDKKLNDLYRGLYDACSGKYALSVPFAQRFFELALSADTDGRGSDYVGQITANSFMKREFGKKLIEQFFAHKIELTHVIDTSGAYIPGHGTPTVILAGRRKDRNRAETIRAVLGVRGEPSAPEDASQGFVWQAIVDQLDHVGSESEWVTVADQPRDQLTSYPWSLTGGGASTVLNELNLAASSRLSDSIDGSIGFYAITGDDEVYLAKRHIPAPWARLGVPHQRFTTGDAVRDWEAKSEFALWPYKERKPIIHLQNGPQFWPYRSGLRAGLTFGKTREQRGLAWHEYTMLSWARVEAASLITFACVSTHNHFVSTKEQTVFNRHAPVIKLVEGASEEEHLRLLGILNSSTACFWLKQVSHDKGNRGGERSTARYAWENFYEFTGTKLQEFPLPEEYPLELATELDRLAQRLSARSPGAVASEAVPTWERLGEACTEWQATRGRMIGLQEELDWEVYSLYGLLPEELTAPAGSVPELKLGERAFEIVLARRMAAGEVETQWFARHGSTPVTEIPAHWPEAYREVIQKRIEIIESNRYIGLIERPECKRRWASEGWDAMRARALRDWLLDRCEDRGFWFHHIDGMEQPRPLTAAQLADELRDDPDVVSVVELYAPGRDFAKVIADLLDGEHVPYLAALRYTEQGLTKRADWEHVWDLQRHEDAATDEDEKRGIRDTIPVPPKYGTGDFLKTSFWRNRGKLDVAKERFVSYPHASRDGDPSLLLGWAGWDHREQAQALATLVVERDQTDGWDAAKLAPLLAGLREVLPWVRQWHGEFDPLYGGSPADVYAGFLADYTNRLRLTEATLAGWRPARTTRGRKKTTLQPIPETFAERSADPLP